MAALIPYHCLITTFSTSNLVAGNFGADLCGPNLSRSLPRHDSDRGYSGVALLAAGGRLPANTKHAQRLIALIDGETWKPGQSALHALWPGGAR
ncbi:hypothetical protein [Mycobacterium spongiae]|uniref:Uncharacterized protein n=1 Tax=Mycobacterium spongiae TaxID=886343 RepID=A0A975PXF2_9MYCO|nr:hypothetical protein [Mycobacterium spongiae]QUR67754.1 hypothetical protein F6B93_12160 [Mycobacterium spongiae]